MKLKILSILLLSSVFFTGCATWDGVKKDSSKAWETTKEISSETWDSTKKAVNKATKD